MPEKIFFYILLILCEILSQGINEAFADGNIKESSNFLLRQKRVVNRLPGQDRSILIEDVPYVVIVRQNGRIKCVGSILSHRVVITSPQCVLLEPQNYQIVYGTIRTDFGRITNVTDIRRTHANRPSRFQGGIALLAVNPPFVYGRKTSNIPLHSEPLLHGTHGIVSGWGYNYRCEDRGTSIPLYLRSIQVPIIHHQICANIYRPRNIEITDADVCTYHALQHCGHTDEGAPLAVQGHLVGIHLFTGPHEGMVDPQYPEVFALLQDSAYYQWITANMHDIEARFQNHNN